MIRERAQNKRRRGRRRRRRGREGEWEKGERRVNGEEDRERERERERAEAPNFPRTTRTGRRQVRKTAVGCQTGFAIEKASSVAQNRQGTSQRKEKRAGSHLKVLRRFDERRLAHVTGSEGKADDVMRAILEAQRLWGRTRTEGAGELRSRVFMPSGSVEWRRSIQVASR